MNKKYFKPIRNDTTQFGFAFGSLEVTRTCTEKLTATISIKTSKCKFSVRATKNGSVRVFDEQGNECEIVSKSYMDQLNNKADDHE